MSYQYRKKPVVIEAWQLVADGHTRELPPPWLMQALLAEPPTAIPQEDGSLIIHTLEGDHRADPGDYIIRGVKGELYPYKPDIFELTYDRMEAPLNES